MAEFSEGAHTSRILRRVELKYAAAARVGRNSRRRREVPVALDGHMQRISRDSRVIAAIGKQRRGGMIGKLDRLRHQSGKLTNSQRAKVDCDVFRRD